MQRGLDLPALLPPAVPRQRGPVSLPSDGRNAAVGTVNNGRFAACAAWGDLFCYRCGPRCVVTL